MLLPMAVLEDDTFAEQTCERNLEYFKDQLRCLDERGDEPKMANVLQACIDNLSAVQAEGRHSFCLSRVARRMKLDLLVNEGNEIVWEIGTRACSRELAALDRERRRQQDKSMSQTWTGEKAPTGQHLILDV